MKLLYTFSLDSKYRLYYEKVSSVSSQISNLKEMKDDYQIQTYAFLDPLLLHPCHDVNRVWASLWSTGRQQTFRPLDSDGGGMSKEML